MARETGIPLQKVTLNLQAGDKETLTSFYTVKGWSVAAREIIHNHCEWLREKDSQEIQTSIDSLDIKLPLIENLAAGEDI